MGDIVLLDEKTINKIAAGEVVDRPASIVKEMVENSIDANASSITVEIKNGGISYICITDNGKGFKSDDIDLAFERHATSKIRKEEDLLTITSMGFRGEALASVSAISRITLTTKNENEDVGMRVRVEAGNIISKEEYATVTGTKIEIRDVFFNTPARFKFLKKDYTEAGYIEDAVTRIALSHPSINFKYINNSKVVLQTRGTGNLKDTIYDIFGKEVYDAVIPVDYETQDMKIQGMLGLPSISRSTRTQQFTYINDRFIKDKTVSSAIDRACEEKYAINKHPFVVINIHLNPATVDVNVHPAKLEVKFSDESKVFDNVFHALRGALEKNSSQTSPFTIAKEKLENNIKAEEITKELKKENIVKESSYNNTAFSKLYSKPKEPEHTNINALLDSLNEKVGNINIDSVDNVYNLESKNENNNNKTNDNTNIIKNDNNENNNSNKDKEKVEESYEQTKIIPTNSKEKIEETYEYIGTVYDTYIIIRMGDKIYFVDQHAAHERELFEQIKEDYYSKKQSTQMLLIPLLIGVSQKEMDIVKNNMELFENAGFILDEFGDNTIKISGVPNVGYKIDDKSMFKDIITELSSVDKTERQQKEWRFLATLACKSAVKGGTKLDVEEQKRLIDNMICLDNPFNCPHGRPTAISFSRYEIERKFMRK